MIRPKALTSLSIVFPCYNEFENLDPMIEQSVQTAEAYGADYEVLVVDDGSRDGSGAKVERWAQKNPRVRLIRHETNRGYGAAVRTGLAHAKKDLVFLTDGDNQFHPADIDKLFSKIDGCDVVTGFRMGRQDQPLRRLNGRLWTGLCRVLFGLPVRDVDCAFKLFRRKCLEGIKLESEQLLIYAELLAKLRKKGCVIEEIGIPHYPRKAGTPSATALPRVLGTFRELFTHYWKIR